MITNEIIRIPRKRIIDIRGFFLKIIDGNEPGNPFHAEVYVTSAKPGESKGGHYHRIANEWFTLVKGEALLIIVNVDTLERKEIDLKDQQPETIFIPPGYAHSFKNVGDEDYILVAFTDVLYKPEDTILFDM
jgi:UDP-2-acetamido-2,6-beta-L-arabino-hexul-4-ose reductase